MTITTQAAVVETGGAPFTLVDVELDEPRADEVLVRMTAAGLCHTDLGVASGGLPFPLPGVLGHEGAGVVERVGSAVTSVVPGDFVAKADMLIGTCASRRKAASASLVSAAKPALKLSAFRMPNPSGSTSITNSGGVVKPAY